MCDGICCTVLYCTMGRDNLYLLKERQQSYLHTAPLTKRIHAHMQGALLRRLSIFFLLDSTIGTGTTSTCRQAGRQAGTMNLN